MWQEFCHNCGKRLRVPELSDAIIDDRVLEYVKASKGGAISITRVSEELDIDRERLMSSLSRLQTKGQIQIDAASKSDNPS